MPQMNVLLRHDDIDPYATLPIVIKQEALSSLSPDSTYFIPLRIKDVSGFQIKEENEMSYVVFIHIMNMPIRKRQPNIQ